MADPAEAPPAAPAETAPVVEAPAAPAVEAPAAVPPVETQPAEIDPFDDPALDKFERSYVEKLRQEAGDTRVALKPYKEAFDAYSPEEQSVLMGLIRDLANDETAADAAGRMKALAERMLAPDEEPPTAEPTAEPEAFELPTTKEEFAALIEAQVAEREANRKAAEAETKAGEDAVAAVIAEATTLGYKEGTDEYVTLLLRASQQYNGEVAAAHAAITAEKQAVIDSFVAEQTALGAAFPKVAGGSSAPSEAGGGHDGSWAAARKSMQARARAK